ncbi:MAG: 4Fe-4S dicluster domain-containing protein [Dehalococcoidia bacterium]
MTGSLAAVPPAALAAFATLDSCVQCGFCLPTCPTYRETYREQSSPRGRIQLMLAVRGRSLDALDPTFAGQMDECLDCRACGNRLPECGPLRPGAGVGAGAGGGPAA